MITLLYSTLATPSHPFADATLLVNDDGHYLLSIPTMEDWTSAEIQIGEYPPVDVVIEDSVIEIEGDFFDPEEDLWVNISIARGKNFGGQYRFPLEIVPLPTAMPAFDFVADTSVERTHSFWWRSADATPFLFFWEKHDVEFFRLKTSSR